ncbi:MAG: septum formation inhibitor Maf [Gammaproteobacteria bacterium]|nr:septum formation inhibitor Maf [Gammaproteobacteria bacterium]
MSAEFYLASTSPRRRQLLEQLGMEPTVLRIDLDESRQRDETPEVYVLRLASTKAEKGRSLLPIPQHPVLAADTAVVIGNQILGKPLDHHQGVSMLQQLSGRQHEVLTAVALLNDRMETRLTRNRVTFRQITIPEAQAYWETGEPADKAGGYAIQGLGALFISHIEGSYSGVMGLPLFETAQLLQNAGIDPLSYQQRTNSG